MKTVSDAVSVRREADGAGKEVKPLQKPLTDPEIKGY